MSLARLVQPRVKGRHVSTARFTSHAWRQWHLPSAVGHLARPSNPVRSPIELPRAGTQADSALATYGPRRPLGCDSFFQLLQPPARWAGSCQARRTGRQALFHVLLLRQLSNTTRGTAYVPRGCSVAFACCSRPWLALISGGRTPPFCAAARLRTWLCIAAATAWVESILMDRRRRCII